MPTVFHNRAAAHCRDFAMPNWQASCMRMGARHKIRGRCLHIAFELTETTF